jgi:hypothetical protein
MQVRTALIVLALLYILDISASACQCVGKITVCAAINRDNKVFLGKAVVIKIRSHRKTRSYRRIVTFEVFETFRGMAERKVEVITGIGFGDCGFPFKVGSVYLVYAGKDSETGRWETSVCNRTARVDNAEAEADLHFLRSLASMGPEGKIYGYVSTVRPNRWEEYQGKGAIPGVAVWLESSQGRLKAVTDARGEYEFNGLLPGTFRLWADLPGQLGGGAARDLILRPQACDRQPFIAVEQAEISGVVRGSDGRAVKHIWIEVLRADDGEPAGIQDGFSDDEGRYRIHRLPQGRYVLGVHVKQPPQGSKHFWKPYERSYYPGVPEMRIAQVVEVATAQKVTLGEWKLGNPMQKRTIRGIVFGPDAKPASGVFVSLIADGYDGNAHLAETKRDGTFLLEGLAGLQYHVEASVPSEVTPAWHSHALPVPAGDVPLVIRLDRPGKECDECRKAK